MSSHPHSIVDRSVTSANAWLDELAAELGDGDRHAAYQVLRAFLHALRDRLTVDEAAQLAAQLPTLIRGIYYEGWDPSRTPRTYGTAHEFLAAVEEQLSGAGDTQTSFAVEAAAKVLRHHVSPGEIEDVLAVLPGPVRQFVG